MRFIFHFLSLPITYPRQFQTYIPGTYDANARGSDACSGSQSLRQREHNRTHTPSLRIEIKTPVPPGIESGPPGRRQGLFIYHATVRDCIQEIETKNTPETFYQSSSLVSFFLTNYLFTLHFSEQII